MTTTRLRFGQSPTNTPKFAIWLRFSKFQFSKFQCFFFKYSVRNVLNLVHYEINKPKSPKEFKFQKSYFKFCYFTLYFLTWLPWHGHKKVNISGPIYQNLMKLGQKCSKFSPLWDQSIKKSKRIQISKIIFQILLFHLVLHSFRDMDPKKSISQDPFVRIWWN